MSEQTDICSFVYESSLLFGGRLKRKYTSLVIGGLYADKYKSGIPIMIIEYNPFQKKTTGRKIFSTVYSCSQMEYTNQLQRGIITKMTIIEMAGNVRDLIRFNGCKSIVLRSPTGLRNGANLERSDEMGRRSVCKFSLHTDQR